MRRAESATGGRGGLLVFCELSPAGTTGEGVPYGREPTSLAPLRHRLPEVVLRSAEAPVDGMLDGGHPGGARGSDLVSALRVRAASGDALPLRCGTLGRVAATARGVRRREGAAILATVHDRSSGGALAVASPVPLASGRAVSQHPRCLPSIDTARLVKVQRQPSVSTSG